jgi:hypothetical protein
VLLEPLRDYDDDRPKESVCTVCLYGGLLISSISQATVISYLGMYELMASICDTHMVKGFPFPIN